MRYHYKKPKNYRSNYGSVYICNHPVYSRCTLYKIGNKGLAVIQQRYNVRTKSTYWTDFNHYKFTTNDGSECTDICMVQQPILDFEDYC